MFLYINTTERDSFVVAIVSAAGVVKQKKVKSERQHSAKLLKTINELVRERELRGIAVVKGPGSFTSLRIGVVTANTLGYALGIPVAGVNQDFILHALPDLFKRPQKGIVLPEYGSEPHITPSKK